jgi:hypothetical protein
VAGQLVRYDGRVRDASSERAKMDIPKYTERIATERNCPPELVRAIVTDCLSALHESTVKSSGRRRSERTGNWGRYQHGTSMAFWLELPNANLVN